jgi:hypothetical protein
MAFTELDHAAAAKKNGLKRLRQLVRDLRRDADTAFRQEDKVEAIGKIRSALDSAALESSEILWSAQRAQIAEYHPG